MRSRFLGIGGASWVLRVRVSIRVTVSKLNRRFVVVLLADRTIGRAFGTLCRLSVCRLSVTFCIVTKRYVLKKNCLKEWIGDQGQKVDFFGSLPYLYFRFHRYGHRGGRFCLIFAHTGEQLVQNGTIGLSSSKPCAYCGTLWSEFKPEVVLATINDPERCKWPQNDYKWAGIALLTSPTGFLLVARLDHTTRSRNIKLEVVLVQKMARYASFCFIMGPFNHFTACMPDFSGTQENTQPLVPELSGTFYCI